MDAHYDELFDGGDEDDAIFRAKIPTLPAQVMRDLVVAYVDQINTHPIEFAKWARFKYEILKYETKWNMQGLFSWGFETCNTISIDYARLDNGGARTSRYFQVLMAFDDVWFGGDDKTIDFWQPVYDALDEDAI